MKSLLKAPALCLHFFVLAAVFAILGCASALKVNGVVVTSVDGAMKGWAAWTQTHAVPDTQIIAVSNAYVSYYNSELVLSNTFVVAVTQTNNSLLQTVTASATASAQNLLALIQSFSK